MEGYIATTHFDGDDIITKNALQSWASEINEGNPRVNKVSVHHERMPHVAGVGVKGTARVDNLPDGEHGLYVQTRIDKTREDIGDITYRLENDFLDSFSIEYIAPEECTHDENTGARILDERTQLHGWTLASQPMNEHAVMIKEILKQSKEGNKMSEEETPAETPAEVPVEEPAKEEEIKAEEPVEETPKEEMQKAAEEAMPTEEKELFKKFKAIRAKEHKEAEHKRIAADVVKHLREDLKDFKVENKVLHNKDVENKEVLDYKEAVKFESTLSASSQFKAAGKMSDKLGLTTASGAKESAMNAIERATKGMCQFDTKLTKSNGYAMEYKGLGITTNQNTDTDYLLSSAELSDVFDPVIYNYLNWKTATWNVLQKDDYSMKGNNQVQFTGVTAGNTTAAAYTGNAVTTSNTTRLKYMTKFKKYAVGVEVDGDMIAAARGGPIGDVFAQEVKDATGYLLSVMNAALYAEVGLETVAGVIGFEFICDGVGNGTLYNLTRSAANRLLATTATDTYINGNSVDVTSANMRKAIRNLIEESGDTNNAVFFTSPIQYDKIKTIYEDQGRNIVPMSMRFGFEGLMTFDGIPVFYDKDCNDDDIYLVDLETHRIAIWVPPTLEMLGKDSDSQKGFIKTYWCTYNRCPRRMVMIYGNKTT